MSQCTGSYLVDAAAVHPIADTPDQGLQARHSLASGDARMYSGMLHGNIARRVLNPDAYTIKLNNNKALHNSCLYQAEGKTQLRQRLPFVTMSIMLDNKHPFPHGFPCGKELQSMMLQDDALIDTGSMFSMLKKTYAYLLGRSAEKFHDAPLSRYRFLTVVHRLRCMEV